MTTKLSDLPSFLPDQVPIKLKNQFRESVIDQIEKMSPEDREIFQEFLRDPSFVLTNFILGIDVEAYELRLAIYDQMPVRVPPSLTANLPPVSCPGVLAYLSNRNYLMNLFMSEKRASGENMLKNLNQALDCCFSVDQRKLYGAKESVWELRENYFREASNKWDRGVFYNDFFPFFSTERRKDELVVRWDYHLYFNPKNEREFENLFELIAILSIQEAHTKGEKPDLFEREEGQKDILIMVYDRDGRCLNYKGEPFSAFIVEKYRPLIKKMAREYIYDRFKDSDPDLNSELKKETVRSQKEIEDLIFKSWVELILNYKKGKETIPTYFKKTLRELFLEEDKVEIVDYEQFQKRDHFIDDVIRQHIESINFKDAIDEVIGLNFFQSESETQQIIKDDLTLDISREAIRKRKKKLEKFLQGRLKKIYEIAERARREVPTFNLPECVSDKKIKDKEKDSNILLHSRYKCKECKKYFLSYSRITKCVEHEGFNEEN